MNSLFPAARKLFINVFVIVEIQVRLSKLVREVKHTELESLYNRILPNDSMQLKNLLCGDGLIYVTLTNNSQYCP